MLAAVYFYEINIVLNLIKRQDEELISYEDKEVIVIEAQTEEEEKEKDKDREHNTFLYCRILLF